MHVCDISKKLLLISEGLHWYQRESLVYYVLTLPITQLMAHAAVVYAVAYYEIKACYEAFWYI